MSETTVVQPTAGQTVVTTESGHRGHNDHHGHHGSHHPDNWDLSAQMQRDSNAVGNELGRGFTAGALASCKTDDGVAAAGAGVLAAVCSTSSTLRRDICDLGDKTAAFAKDSAIAAKDGLVTAYQIESRGLLEAAKNASLLQIQADKNFYALSVENVKNASAAQLEAQKNAAAIAMQVAECCCELKQLVTSEGVSTRGLIESNEKARLQAQIVELTARLLRVPPLPS